jgi:hypothetical protein
LADHTLYVQQFEESVQATDSGRIESEKARNYFDGNQFTAAETKIAQQAQAADHAGEPDPPQDRGAVRSRAAGPGRSQGVAACARRKEDAANAATDALRYVEQDQDLDIKKSKVFENMLIEGEGAVEVTVRQLKNGVVDPYVVRIAWHRLYGDPHSSEPDRSDASFVGYVTWMDFERAKLKWPDKEDVLTATQGRGASSTFDSMEDKPAWASWYDSKRKRIRINTHYHLVDGVWHVRVHAGRRVGRVQAVGVHRRRGQPECPLIMQAAYVDQDNDRYGIVRDMIPLQDEVNKRRSKFLHLVNSNKIRVSPSIGQDKEAIRKEYAKPDAVFIGEHGEVEELGNISKEQGQFQLLQDTRATLKGNIGPNAYMQGKQGQDQSGRAILAQQQAGMTEMTPLLDNLRHFTLRVYRQIWNRIRQYWTAERWVRVTDDENNVKFVGLNTPPKMGPEQAMAARCRFAMHEQRRDRSGHRPAIHGPASGDDEAGQQRDRARRGHRHR